MPPTRTAISSPVGGDCGTILLMIRLRYPQYIGLLFLLVTASPLAAQFRVAPYVQYPRTNAISVFWFTDTDRSGTIECREAETDKLIGRGETKPVRVTALAYTPWEAQRFFAGDPPAPPYRHRANIVGLSPGKSYKYKVVQGDATFEGSFKSAPDGDTPVRFAVYADCETEPESTGTPTMWPDPKDPQRRRPYLLDQTNGYALNIDMMRRRKPDFIVIAGDIVETGGEQRDWDEFWKHNTNPDPARSLAASAPILPVLGNHDYYAGSHGGPWHQAYGGADPVLRYRAYFLVPDNKSEHASHRGRYYRFDYGPVTLIAIDSNNGQPHRSQRDTNFGLKEKGEGGDRDAPDFNPGSPQHRWLVDQLVDARRKAKFVFVAFHHTPYSSGPHGRPPGEGRGYDTLSSVPTQVLTATFMEHRVDAVFGGHDEMLERSEIRDDKTGHVMHVYDVGIGGDGLRAPTPGVLNSRRKFLAHFDSPERWKDGQLVSGGKHYGHVEVNVVQEADRWKAVLTPVYALPVFDPDRKRLTGYRRMAYDDVVTLTYQAGSKP